jgi:hypothetical protein
MQMTARAAPAQRERKMRRQMRVLGIGGRRRRVAAAASAPPSP